MCCLERRLCPSAMEQDRMWLSPQQVISSEYKSSVNFFFFLPQGEVFTGGRGVVVQTVRHIQFSRFCSDIASNNLL